MFCIEKTLLVLASVGGGAPVTVPNVAYPMRSRIQLYSNQNETIYHSRGSLEILDKFVSTVVPVYLTSFKQLLTCRRLKAYFKNSMSCRLVNTILVLSQSSIPDLSFSKSNNEDVSI